jgi:acetolactate decarboxylase
MDDSITGPFAAVTWFDTDSTKTFSDISNFAELTKALDKMRTSNELFYAYKIDGKFSYIKTRSVPPQEQPYPLLSEVTKNQPIFEYENVEGSLIGFWCPDYVGQVNVPGYHLHFLSADKTMGGHLIEVTMEEGTAFADLTSEFVMKIPETVISADMDDPEKEIEKVEK